LVGEPESKRICKGLGVDGRTILKLILKKQDMRAWSGFIWLGRGTGREIFSTWQLTSGLHKGREIA
jgi:hypothetical protein